MDDYQHGQLDRASKSLMKGEYEMRLGQLASLCQYAFVLVLLMFLVGCNTPVTPITPSTAMTTPSKTTMAPTVVLDTPPPNPVLATTTPSPTCTLAPSTVTPWPTLAANERQQFAREMLATNDGCELPCWWGTMPGQTDWQTVRNRFIAIGGFVFEMPHPQRLFDYYIDLSFEHNNGVVQSVQVTSGTALGYSSVHFAQDWHRYSLDQVLTRYGKPSQVMLELWPNPPVPNYPYKLFVFYDHLGILIEYEGEAIRGEPFRVCPVFEQVTSIRLWLQSPGSSTSLLQLANLDSLEVAQMLPLEKATGVSLETFHQTFKDAKARTCLKSPSNVWSSH